MGREGEDGVIALDGKYKFEVDATDDHGQAINVQRGSAEKSYQ